MRTKQLVLTALFAALTAIGAFLKIQIPVEGIPAITLQFFFTAMAGVLLGAKYGAISQAVYVLLGLPHPCRMVTRRTAAPRASTQPVFPRHAPSPPINTARWPGCCAPNRRMSPRSTSARSFTPGRAAGYAAQTATASRASATANGFICCSVTAWAPARRPPARQRPPAACSVG